MSLIVQQQDKKEEFKLETIIKRSRGSQQVYYKVITANYKDGRFPFIKAHTEIYDSSEKGSIISHRVKFNMFYLDRESAERGHNLLTRGWIGETMRNELYNY